jgi:flagellar basal-body rod protein FlgB
MISSNAYNFINVLDKAADASWLRNEVLSNNLANVSTPNYKRKDVEFESYLSAEIEGTKAVNSLREAVDNLDVNGLRMRTYNRQLEPFISFRW